MKWHNIVYMIALGYEISCMSKCLGKEIRLRLVQYQSAWVKRLVYQSAWVKRLGGD